jgi:hypothetical protein
VLGELAAPEEGVLVVPEAGLLGLEGDEDDDDEDEGGVADVEDFAGSFLPQAASANAAITAKSRLFVMTILLKVGGKTPPLADGGGGFYRPIVVPDTAGYDAAQISVKRPRMASPSVSSPSPMAPRKKAATGRRT